MKMRTEQNIKPSAPVRLGSLGSVKKLSLMAGIGWAVVLLWSGQVSAQDGAGGKTLYQNRFEQAPVDKVPEDFLVLAGAFAVKEEAGNKFLELPGAPVDDFGVLFGPTETFNVALSARIRGTGKGRRFPAFAVGLGGVGGFKLQVAPAKKALELCKGDEVVQSVPFVWTSASWTQLRIQVRKIKDGEWKVEGNAWKEGGAEPATWMISQTETTEPAAGRALVSGNPFSGNPIHFDDLVVSQLTTQP